MTTDMYVLLLDVDSVLIEPHGYRRAFIETIRYLGDLFGVKGNTLTEEQINAFEAAGISSEWDSSTMCMIYLLKHIWRSDPDFQIPDRMQKPTVNGRIKAPGYDGLIQQMAASTLSGRMVAQRSEDVLLADDNLTPAQRALVRQLIRQSRTPASLPFLIFQELIIGSQLFEKVYAQPAVFSTQSYLQLYDIPLITPDDTREILEWSKQPGQASAIFTSRPGLADGIDGMTPDAELGIELIGLQDLPVTSVGQLAWLARNLDLDEQKLVKPSPVHAMLALLLAVHTPKEEIIPAMDCFLSGKNHPALEQFGDTKVSVLEDSINGITSLKNAGTVLESLGIRMKQNYIGITDLAFKAKTLSDAGAMVYNRLEDALSVILR